MGQLTKLGQSSDWATGGGSSGILGPAQDGLGFGGGSQGLPNEMSIPSGHTGDQGAHWSGNLVTDEPFMKSKDRASLRELSVEDLIKQIKNLLKINTRESNQSARSLFHILEDKMRRMKAARRAFELTKIGQTQLQPLQFNPSEQKVIDKVREAAEALNIDIYLVGGFIRDRISGQDKEKEAAGDLDFMCEHDAPKVVAYLVKKYGYPEPVEYSRSKAIMLNMDEHPVDFIDAKHIFRPLKLEGYSTLEEEEDETVAFDDAYRRDFTVNSLMYDVRKGELLDPTGRGVKDLQAGVLNTIIDPFIKFRVHAPDMLRAIRFVATLGFKLGPNMLEAMKANASRVQPRDKGGDISNRRIRKELRKAIDNPEHWARMRELLQQAGLDIVLADDIQDVQDDFEGGIDYHLDEDEKSKLLEKQEKAMCLRLTKVAQSDIINISDEFYLLPLSSRKPINGYSLIQRDVSDPNKGGPDKVVGFVSHDSKIGAWRWEPMRSDHSYGKFSSPEEAAQELIRQLPKISYRDSLPVFNASTKQFTRLSGVMDWFKKKEPVLDFVRRQDEAAKRKKEELKKQPQAPGLRGVQPASVAERIQYLAQKADELLKKVPSDKHQEFILNFLSQYKISRGDPRYVEILSLLRNYRGKSVAPATPSHERRDIWRD